MCKNPLSESRHKKGFLITHNFPPLNCDLIRIFFLFLNRTTSTLFIIWLLIIINVTRYLFTYYCYDERKKIVEHFFLFYAHTHMYIYSYLYTGAVRHDKANCSDVKKVPVQLTLIFFSAAMCTCVCKNDKPCVSKSRCVHNIHVCVHISFFNVAAYYKFFFVKTKKKIIWTSQQSNIYAHIHILAA